MNTGFQFIPKFVRQESDLAYGEKVTHENYNEKLNLNTTQGDYNTEVLFKLFNNINKEETYHIPYLDKDVNDINEDLSGVHTSMDNLEAGLEEANTDIDNLETAIGNIGSGTTVVGRSATADRLTGDATAGPNKYYGTNASSVPGYYSVPDFIYAVDMETSTGVEGVYYIPALNSVTESMLATDLRTKVNRAALADYEYLTNLPKLNNVTIMGNKVSADYGLQPAGDYVTNSALNNKLNSYYTITAAQAWVNGVLEDYATTEALSNVSTTANSASLTATAAYDRAFVCARVGVNAYPANPQNGDIYFAV